MTEHFDPKTQYVCGLCRGIFNLVRDKTWSEERANEEYKKTFPGQSLLNRDIVCDDCWKIVRPQ